MSRPMTPFRQGSAHGQRGITLIAAVLMLLIFGLVTVAAFRNTLSSAQSIGNMQFRNESIAAANDTIDQILSSDAYFTQPGPMTQQLNTTPNTVDINGDNVPDIKVTFPTVQVAGNSVMGPQCLRYRPVQNAQLDPSLPSNQGCFGSSGDFSGLSTVDSSGSATPISASTSNCADTDWTVTVQATDQATNTSVQVTQGVQIRRDRATASNFCK